MWQFTLQFIEFKIEMGINASSDMLIMAVYLSGAGLFIDRGTLDRKRPGEHT